MLIAPDRQELDGPFEAHQPPGAELFQGWQANHLRAVKKELPGVSLGGIDGKLRHRLAEQFADGLADHLVGHIEGVHVDDLPGERSGGAGYRGLAGGLKFFSGRSHC